jgi:hypothetical protein
MPEECLSGYARKQEKLLDVTNDTEIRKIIDEYFEGESSPRTYRCIPALFEVLASVAGARPRSSLKVTSFVIAILHEILEPVSAAIKLVEELVASPGEGLETAMSSLGTVWPRSVPVLSTTGRLAVAVSKLRGALAEEVGITAFDALVAGAVGGSPLWSFKHVWQRARSRAAVDPAFVDFRGWKMIRAAAADNVAELGPLLRNEDVNAEFWLEAEPESMCRRAEKVTILDVAMSSGAVRSAKLLLVFHDAKVTDETLAMALSSGDLELIRLVWDRLPDSVRNRKLDHAMVAAEWHRFEPLMWLLREASPVELELFACFALETHLADAIMAVFDGQLKPWLKRSRAAASKWGPAQKLETGREPRAVEAPTFSKRLRLGVAFDRTGRALVWRADEVDVDDAVGGMERLLLIKNIADLPFGVSEPELVFAERLPPGDSLLRRWDDFMAQMWRAAPLLILGEGSDGFAFYGELLHPTWRGNGDDSIGFDWRVWNIGRWVKGKYCVDRVMIEPDRWSVLPSGRDNGMGGSDWWGGLYYHKFGSLEVWRP